MKQFAAVLALAVAMIAANKYNSSNQSNFLTGGEYDPRTPPAIPNAMDDEFTGAALSGIWTEVTSSGASITKTFNSPGVGFAKITFGGTGQIYGILQAIPSGDWEFTARCGASVPSSGTTNYARCTMFLAAGTANTDKHYGVHIDMNNSDSNGRAITEYNTALATFSAIKGSTYSGFGGLPRMGYRKIKKVSTTYSFLASLDGISYRLTQSGGIGEFTPSHIGIYAQDDTVAGAEVFFDFFRRTQ
jgi:hypothetical protein